MSKKMSTLTFQQWRSVKVFSVLLKNSLLFHIEEYSRQICDLLKNL